MTILVGIIDQQKSSAYLYADTKITIGDHQSPTDVTKILDYEFAHICSCGSLHGINVIETYFNPVWPTPNEDTYQYLLKKFIPALIAAHVEGGSIIENDGLLNPNSYIVAIDGRLFLIGMDFSISEYKEFVADGCGAAYAYGALYATRSAKNVKKRATLAIEAASEFDAACGRNITSVESKPWDRSEIEKKLKHFASAYNKKAKNAEGDDFVELSWKDLAEIGFGFKGELVV